MVKTSLNSRLAINRTQIDLSIRPFMRPAVSESIHSSIVHARREEDTVDTTDQRNVKVNTKGKGVVRCPISNLAIRNACYFHTVVVSFCLSTTFAFSQRSVHFVFPVDLSHAIRAICQRK